MSSQTTLYGCSPHTSGQPPAGDSAKHCHTMTVDQFLPFTDDSRHKIPFYYDFNSTTHPNFARCFFPTIQIHSIKDHLYTEKISYLILCLLFFRPVSCSLSSYLIVFSIFFSYCFFLGFYCVKKHSFCCKGSIEPHTNTFRTKKKSCTVLWTHLPFSQYSQICIGNNSKQFTRCYFGAKSFHTTFFSPQTSNDAKNYVYGKSKVQNTCMKQVHMCMYNVADLLTNDYFIKVVLIFYWQMQSKSIQSTKMRCLHFMFVF